VRWAAGVLALAGVGLVVVGAGLVWVPAGLIVAGVCLLMLARAVVLS